MFDLGKIQVTIPHEISTVLNLNTVTFNNWYPNPVSLFRYYTFLGQMNVAIMMNVILLIQIMVMLIVLYRLKKAIDRNCQLILKKRML